MLTALNTFGQTTIKCKKSRDHNVIKIKPPMIFNKQNADELVLKLSEVLSNIEYE